jgi:hypothetical protein
MKVTTDLSLFASWTAWGVRGGGPRTSKRGSNAHRAEGRVRRTGDGQETDRESGQRDHFSQYASNINQGTSHTCPGTGVSWTSLDMTHAWARGPYLWTPTGVQKGCRRHSGSEKSDCKPCPSTPHKLNTPTPIATIAPPLPILPQILITNLCQCQRQRMVRW